jgi:hypothetical protein
MPIAMRLLRLTPVEAVIEFAGPGEIRGRLTGPRCAYTTTIEVAYHVRDNRVIIPEPSWWDPESPFLYRGPVALWRGAKRLEQENAQIGLRHIVRTGDRIIHNGRRLELNRRRIDAVDEVALGRAREAGVNAVEVPAMLAEAVCDIADRIGLFVISDGPTAIDVLRHPSAITS